MGFTFILPVFVALVIGSTFPAQAAAARVRRHGICETGAPGCAEDGEHGAPGGHAHPHGAPLRVGCPTTIKMFEENNGFCYFFSELLPNPNHDHGITDADSWEDAKLKCENLKGTYNLDDDVTIGLAEFGASDNFESDEWLMLQIIEQDHPVWLGAYEVDNHNTWKWDRLDRVDRKLSLLDAYWGPGQPNNWPGDHRCLSTIQQGNDVQLTPVGVMPVISKHRQYFNDEDCNRALPYVCQFKL